MRQSATALNSQSGDDRSAHIDGPRVAMQTVDGEPVWNTQVVDSKAASTQALQFAVSCQL